MHRLFFAVILSRLAPVIKGNNWGLIVSDNNVPKDVIGHSLKDHKLELFSLQGLHYTPQQYFSMLELIDTQVLVLPRLPYFCSLNTVTLCDGLLSKKFTKLFLTANRCRIDMPRLFVCLLDQCREYCFTSSIVDPVGQIQRLIDWTPPQFVRYHLHGSHISITVNGLSGQECSAVTRIQNAAKTKMSTSLFDFKFT